MFARSASGFARFREDGFVHQRVQRFHPHRHAGVWLSDRAWWVAE
jgi:hypothetical protein